MWELSAVVIFLVRALDPAQVSGHVKYIDQNLSYLFKTYSLYSFKSQQLLISRQKETSTTKKKQKTVIWSISLNFDPYLAIWLLFATSIVMESQTDRSKDIVKRT